MSNRFQLISISFWNFSSSFQPVTIKFWHIFAFWLNLQKLSSNFSNFLCILTSFFPVFASFEKFPTFLLISNISGSFRMFLSHFLLFFVTFELFLPIFLFSSCFCRFWTSFCWFSVSSDDIDQFFLFIIDLSRFFFAFDWFSADFR